MYLLGRDHILAVGANQLPGFLCGMKRSQTFCSFLQKVIASALLLACCLGQVFFHFQGNHRLLAAGQMATAQIERDDKGQGRPTPLPGPKLGINVQFQAGPVAVAPVNDFPLVEPDGFQQAIAVNVPHQGLILILCHEWEDGRQIMKHHCHFSIQTIDQKRSRVYTTTTTQNVRSVQFVDRGATMKQTIGVTEARNNFGELVDQVRYRGDTVVLMKSGKPAAAIVPYDLLILLQEEQEKISIVIDEPQKHRRAIETDEIAGFSGSV